MGQVSEMIKLSKGAGLAIDYGENCALEDSLRGIKNHKYQSMKKILTQPGTIDLSAYVNFSALRAAAEAKELSVGGAIPQGMFLEKLGMPYRLQTLFNSTESHEQTEELKSSYL